MIDSSNQKFRKFIIEFFFWEIGVWEENLVIIDIFLEYIHENVAVSQGGRYKHTNYTDIVWIALPEHVLEDQFMADVDFQVKNIYQLFGNAEQEGRTLSGDKLLNLLKDKLILSLFMRKLVLS